MAEGLYLWGSTWPSTKSKKAASYAPAGWKMTIRGCLELSPMDEFQPTLLKGLRMKSLRDCLHWENVLCYNMLALTVRQCGVVPDWAPGWESGDLRSNPASAITLALWPGAHPFTSVSPPTHGLSSLVRLRACWDRDCLYSTWHNGTSGPYCNINSNDVKHVSSQCGQGLLGLES